VNILVSLVFVSFSSDLLLIMGYLSVIWQAGYQLFLVNIFFLPKWNFIFYTIEGKFFKSWCNIFVASFIIRVVVEAFLVIHHVSASQFNKT
jgi:hypothetical protein